MDHGEAYGLFDVGWIPGIATHAACIRGRIREKQRLMQTDGSRHGKLGGLQLDLFQMNTKFLG